MTTVATQGLGFVARPQGGAVFGRIGSTATVLLVIMRLVQGFALGGEFGSAELLVSKQGEPKRRSWWAAWPPVSRVALVAIRTYPETRGRDLTRD